MTSTNEEILQVWGKLVAKAWDDDAFKTILMQDPTGQLRKEGIETPEGADVCVVAEDEVETQSTQEGTVYLPFLNRPTDEELSEADLDTVSGGLNVTGMQPIQTPLLRQQAYIEQRQSSRVRGSAAAILIFVSVID